MRCIPVMFLLFFGASLYASVHFSEEFSAVNPHLRWHRDSDGAAHGAVLSAETNELVHLTVTPEGVLLQAPAVKLSGRYRFIGSRVISRSNGNMTALVHLRQGSDAGIFIIDLGNSLSHGENIPVVPLSPAHEFRDWHAAEDAEGELCIAVTAAPAAFGGASEVLLHRRGEQSSLLRLPGYAADPRLVLLGEHLLLFRREGGRTDRSELAASLVSPAAGTAGAELLRESAGHAFSSSIGLSFTQDPRQYLPRIRDPGPVFFHGDDDQLYMVFQHVTQARTELTPTSSHLELRSYRLSYDSRGTVMLTPGEVIPLTETAVETFTYPGETPVFHLGTLIIPYIIETFRGSQAINDAMAARVSGADASSELLMPTPREITSVGAAMDGEGPVYLWTQRSLTGMHQAGMLRAPQEYGASFPVVRWGDWGESASASVFTYAAALVWAAVLGTLYALPSLVLLRLYLLVLSRRRPDLLHRHTPMITAGGAAFCAAVTAALAGLHAGAVSLVLLPLCCYGYARRFQTSDGGYLGVLKTVWAAVILFLSVGAWPRVFAQLERFMHLQ